MRSAQSSYRDRTQEFQGIADRLKKTVSNAPSSTSSSSRSQLDGSRSAVSIQSEFNKRASKIGFGIHQTSQKLAKLAKLAKRTSVFDDPTVEIQELTAVIKQDITALNSAVVDLQLLCNSQGEIGSTSSDTTTHSTTVVDNLKNRLMTATKEFKEVLTMRTENLKTHENRRQLFSASSSKESTNPFVRQRPLANRSAADGSAAPPPPWANGSSTSSSLFPRKQADGESQPLLQQQSQQQQQQMVPLQDSYMQSRAEALQNVESTIHELGNIFTQLATMVSQQGELAIRIDENMDDTLANVEGAQNQLARYLNSISSNRWLMIKIFFVLIYCSSNFIHIVEAQIHFAAVEDLHFPKLSIPVVITCVHTVTPASKIPVSSGNTLYLSNLDDMIGSRVFTPTVYFYPSNRAFPTRQQCTQTLSTALSEVLVPYYPFSGRLREAKNGKLEVHFGPNQGALLAEAESSLALADLGDLSVPNPGWSPLNFHFPNEDPYKVIDMPLFMVQLTYFRCGGFSIGIRICHCLCDGIGAMQFLGAWAATAKAGALVATPAPCWDREFFTPRDPPCISFPHSEFMSIQDTSTLTMSLWKDKPVQLCFRVTREFQCKLKELAQKEGTDVCSGFDALAGHIWRSWVKALDVKPLEFELRLTFAVNMRRMLKNPPLKDGFYGNAISVACVRSTVEDLISKPLSWTARSVHRTRMGVTEEYLRSTVDYIEHKRPKLLEFGGKLTITQWTRFSMYESADFGQGKPAYVGPIDLTPTPQVCVCVPEGKADLDANILVCICLPEWATHKFKKLFCLMEN
ncbi:hypothetical protein V2J09_010272 [Rumex salicifolius]